MQAITTEGMSTWTGKDEYHEKPEVMVGYVASDTVNGERKYALWPSSGNLRSRSPIPLYNSMPRGIGQVFLQHPLWLQCVVRFDDRGSSHAGCASGRIATISKASLSKNPVLFTFLKARQQKQHKITFLQPSISLRMMTCRSSRGRFEPRAPSCGDVREGMWYMAVQRERERRAAGC